MNDNKKQPQEELQDEQLEEVTGGMGSDVKGLNIGASFDIQGKKLAHEKVQTIRRADS